MRCKNCNVEIACKSSVCPLCHKPLASDGEVPFPTPATKKILMGKFSLAYLVIAVIANIVCITLNFVLTPKILWCVPVLVLFIYVYYFVSVTVLAKRGFHKRILGQALILTAIFAAIKLAIGGNHWIFINPLYKRIRFRFIRQIAIYHRYFRKRGNFYNMSYRLP